MREIGTCLRLIQCQEDTERVVPEDLQRTAFAAWEYARQDIYETWTRETDPANLQPLLSKLCRDVASYLRQHPPRGVDQARLERCLEAVESPISRREENQLRAVFEGDHAGAGAKAQALVEQIAQFTGFHDLVSSAATSLVPRLRLGTHCLAASACPKRPLRGLLGL